MKNKIVITIGGKGSNIDAKGFTGNQCAISTAPYEQVLSGSDGSVERVLKPEYNETNTSTEQQQQQQW